MKVIFSFLVPLWFSATPVGRYWRLYD
jgi:hypothetical protein